MECVAPLNNVRDRLIQVEFGRFESAPELARGDVAAVDGRPVLPIQTYTSGHALCVGVGSLSHTRKELGSLHYWSSHVGVEQARTIPEFLKQQHGELYGISQTAFMRYHEVQHALEIQERLVLLDGPLVYQWLLANEDGQHLYQKLLTSGKRCMGIIKSLKENPWFSLLGRALMRGEVFIAETLRDHLSSSRSPENNRGEGRGHHVRSSFYEEHAQSIVRGIFRPRDKVFGFEVHVHDLDVMLPIMAADCQMNHVGHEIPFILNRVDEQVRHHFRSRPLQAHLRGHIAALGEEIVFREAHEREYR